MATKAARIDFREIKRQARFEAVLDHYGIRLKREGQELAGLCPFHNDTKPSLRVNPDKGLFQCFGCGVKGDIFNFVARKEGVRIREAAEFVVEWCGLSGHGDRKPRQDPGGLGEGATGQRQSAGTPSQPHTEATNRPLTFQLRLDGRHAYLKERGLANDLIAEFGLGYSSRGMMKGRICIPIHDEQGRLVGYAGRWPGDEIPKGEPKYLLPAGFHKSLVLFNLHRVAGAEHIIMVEGYFPVFALHRLGFPAVALMGRSLSEGQEQLLIESEARRITLLFDGDEPGQKAAAQLLPRLARHFFVRVVDLPEGAQPDTLSEDDLRTLLGDN